MTYRLPSAWNPGFALPDNVRAEGLERQAFVTKQARRGTYDDPAVGDAGYAVPQYVKDEGYGRGVYTSAWAPSGSTPGVHVPNYLNQRPQTVASSPAPGGGTAYTVAVPTGAVPTAYKNYGHKVASLVLRKLARMPAQARPQQLKAALDGIDRKLHPRAMAAARQLGNLHAGLAHAFGATLLEQVIETGRRGRAPRRGLMGLAGCVSCGSPSALGALPTGVGGKILTGGLTAVDFSSLIPNAVTGPGGVTAGTCTPDRRFVWDAGGYWRRLIAGEGCVAVMATNPISTGGAGAQGGRTITKPDGTTVTVRPAPIIAPGSTKLITVGPFTFPLVDNIRIHWSGLLPDDWRAAINQEIQRDCSPCISSSMRDATQGYFAVLRQFLGPEMPSRINHDFFGMRMGAGAMIAGSDIKPTMPIATTTRPDTGDKYGLYAYVETANPDKPYDATTNPYNMVIVWKPIDTSVWGWIWNVVSTIGDWAMDAINEIGSLTCDVLSNPAGKIGVVAAGAAAGGPGGAQAGAAGAAIGSQLCAQPAPPQSVSAGSSAGPLILIGASVAAVALLLTKKKKKAP